MQDLQALEDDDVNNVAGGVFWLKNTVPNYTKYNGCRDDFTDDDCIRSDACHALREIYYDCDKTYYAAKCSCGDYIENGENKGCYKVFP